MMVLFRLTITSGADEPRGRPPRVLVTLTVLCSGHMGVAPWTALLADESHLGQIHPEGSTWQYEPKRVRSPDGRAGTSDAQAGRGGPVRSFHRPVSAQGEVSAMQVG
jgi:hypothetical protein